MLALTNWKSGRRPTESGRLGSLYFAKGLFVGEKGMSLSRTTTISKHRRLSGDSVPFRPMSSPKSLASRDDNGMAVGKKTDPKGRISWPNISDAWAAKKPSTHPSNTHEPERLRSARPSRAGYEIEVITQTEGRRVRSPLGQQPLYSSEYF